VNADLRIVAAGPPGSATCGASRTRSNSPPMRGWSRRCGRAGTRRSSAASPSRGPRRCARRWCKRRMC